MPRTPTPWAEIAPFLTDRVVAKFWSFVQRGEDAECWNWTRQVNTVGYGLYYVSGRRTSVLVTRLAYFLEHGTIDDTKYACHTCDNPRCCNPKHLWLGTHLENVSDMWKKGRARPGVPNNRKKQVAA